jgi:hypothetical protein
LKFDGSTVEFAGSEYSFPQLRGALKAGWITLADNYDENDPDYGRPERANIQVRHATQGGNPMAPQQKMTIATTESDEREVGNTTAHAAQTRAANKSYQPGKPVNKTGTQTVRGQNGFEVVEDQDGQVVPGRTLKTAAGEKSKQARTTLTADSAATAIRQVNEVQIDPGRGTTQEEMLEKMTPEQREEYLAQKEAYRSAHVSDPAPRKVVGGVKKAETKTTEGITVKSDVGGGIEIADPIGAGGKAKESTYVEDGITFKNTNGPSPKAQAPQAHPRSDEALAKKAASVDVRRRIAKSMCADFPDNYQFDLAPKKKLARLQADYEDRPDILQAVFAAESDEMKALLIEEFPQAFSA